MKNAMETRIENVKYFNEKMTKINPNMRFRCADGLLRITGFVVIEFIDGDEKYTYFRSLKSAKEYAKF